MQFSEKSCLFFGIPVQLFSQSWSLYIEDLLKKSDVKKLADLIRQAQVNDLDAFNQIVRRFQDMAVTYAYSVHHEALIKR